METTLIDRILKVLTDHKYSDTNFCKQYGIKPSNMTAWKSGNRTVPPKYVIDIIELFPEIDARWLITGEEDQDKFEAAKVKKELKEKIKETEDNLKSLKEEFDKRQKQIIDLLEEIVKLQKENFTIKLSEAKVKHSNT